MLRSDFIAAIAAAAIKYAPGYDIKVVSPVIAQAILESGWGQSQLAAKYHNYFGLKCGSSWKGRSVNMKTQEEYTVGTLTTIKDNFRVFDSLEEGVKGYFDFINTKRYANLKGIEDPLRYLQLIKQDGYATSSKYVENVYRVLQQNDLTQFDHVTVTPTNPDSGCAPDEGKCIALEVIAGKWGNGMDRKNRLNAAGYDYATIQKCVNRMLKS